MNITTEDILRWKLMDRIAELVDYGRTATDIIDYAAEYTAEATTAAFEASDLYSEALNEYVSERNVNEDFSWGELVEAQRAFGDSDECRDAYKRWEEWR